MATMYENIRVSVQLFYRKNADRGILDLKNLLQQTKKDKQNETEKFLAF